MPRPPVIHPRFLALTAGTLGRGAGVWVRTRYTGDGVLTPRVPASGSVSLYAWKQSDLGLPQALVGQEVSNNGWWVGAQPGTDLQGDDVLTSVADTALALIIIGPAADLLPGLTLWRAEQQ
jgi:hypothetical protein